MRRLDQFVDRVLAQTRGPNVRSGRHSSVLAISGAVITVALLLLASLSSTTAPALLFPDSTSAHYEEVTGFDDGARHQDATVQVAGKSVPLHLVSFRIGQGTSAAQWLAKIDPTHLLRVQDFKTTNGDGVLVLDNRAWLAAQEGEADLPILAVFTSGDRAVVVERLNGAYVEVGSAFRLLRSASLPQ